MTRCLLVLQSYLIWQQMDQIGLFNINLVQSDKPVLHLKCSISALFSPPGNHRQPRGWPDCWGTHRQLSRRRQPDTRRCHDCSLGQRHPKRIDRTQQQFWQFNRRRRWRGVRLPHSGRLQLFFTIFRKRNNSWIFYLINIHDLHWFHRATLWQRLQVKVVSGKRDSFHECRKVVFVVRFPSFVCRTMFV